MQIVAKIVSSVVLAAVMTRAAFVPRQDPVPGTYDLIWQDFTGAVEGHDFLTFSMLETTDECTAFCDSVANCGFANSFHDVNGKDGSTLFTCSLFRDCHTTDDATNTGGQMQPDGTINYIMDSAGFCKVVAPPPVDPTE